MMRNRLIVTILAGALALFSVTACQRREEDRVQAANESASNSMSEADRQFLMDAERINIEERAVGRLALEKSQNKDVRDYANMLVDDHSGALNNLVKLMQKKGMNQPSNLPEARNEAVNELNNLSGADFDRQFAAMMVQGHEQAIQKFQAEKDFGQDKDVKNYAEDILPKLQKHLEQARELQSKLASSNTNPAPSGSPGGNRRY